MCPGHGAINVSNVEQFKQAIRDVGLQPPDNIQPGKFHRFPGMGKSRGNDAGWCKLFDDLRGGSFGDFSTGLDQDWQAETERTYTFEERQAFKEKCEAERKAREAEQLKRHIAAATQAVKLISAATDDPAQHPYAVKKIVDFGPLVKRGVWPQRGWTDALLIPIYSADGKMSTLEAINADGEKDYLKGGCKRGGFHPLGTIRGANRVLIGEGLATVAAVHAVTKIPAAAAMDKGNLSAVAMAVLNLSPEAEIILLADNDIKPDGSNPGIKAATEAALIIGGRVAIPELNGEKCDFWDVWQVLGADAVLDQLSIQTTSDPWEDGDNIGLNAKPAEYLINRILETSAHGILGAQSQAFKSFLAIKLAHSICTGNDFFGHEVFTTGKVLYVCGEGKGALQRRIKAAQIAFGDFNGNLKIWNGEIGIDNHPSIIALKNDIARLKPALVIFDTFSSLLHGETSENDNGEVAKVLRYISDACSVGKTSSLVIHHFGKDDSKGFRGASAFFNNTDFAFVMKREVDSMNTELSCLKMKDGELFEPITMTARVVGLGMQNQDGTESTSLILELSKNSVLKPKNKTKRALKGNDDVVLTALAEALDKVGIPPPACVKAKYAGFNSPSQSNRKITTRKTWRDQAFQVLSVDSEDDKKKYDAKLKAFNRSVGKLFKDGYVILHDDYVWRLYD